MSTRYVGLCPVCEGRIKVRNDNLVHHGYRRPGVGYILGDCFGVGLLPHEVSSATARAYQQTLTDKIADLEKEVSAVQGADELIYTYKRNVSLWAREQGLDKSEKVQVKRGDLRRYVDSYQIPSFEDVQSGILSQLNYQIQNNRSGVERMQKLIDTWVEQPLLTVEEETIRVTEATKAERAQRKAERDAKNADKRARKAARDARLQVKIDVINAKGRALLDGVDPKDANAVRLAYLQVLGLKLPAAVHPGEYVEKYLDRTELLRSAGLFHAHNDRLMTHAHHVRQVIEASRIKR